MNRNPTNVKLKKSSKPIDVETQITNNIRDRNILEQNKCPFCWPLQTTIKITFRTDNGFVFKCPVHGICGRATELILASQSPSQKPTKQKVAQ